MNESYYINHIDSIMRRYNPERDVPSDGVNVSATEAALVRILRDMLTDMSRLQAQVDRLEIAVDRIEDAL